LRGKEQDKKGGNVRTGRREISGGERRETETDRESLAVVQSSC